MVDRLRVVAEARAQLINRFLSSQTKSNHWHIEMNENFRIDIQLTDGADAALELANVSIDAVLYVQQRVRYRFSAGKTDMRGRLRVTFDQLEKSRLKNQAFSIMDYNTRLQECDSRVSFVVPFLNDLQQRQAAMKRWFPEGALESADIGESNNGKLLCKDVDINVDHGMEQILLECELF
jgi:hypothetical protein